MIMIMWVKQRKLMHAILFILSGMLIPVMALAQTPSGGGVDAITMLVNLSKTYPDLISMITGACFIIGMVLALRGVYYLRAYGELRTMTQSQTTMRTPITLFIVAAVFMYLPNAFQTLITTSFGYDSPMAYDQASSSIDPVILKALVGLVQLIGLIAFVRGWLVLVAHA